MGKEKKGEKRRKGRKSKYDTSTSEEDTSVQHKAKEEEIQELKIKQKDVHDSLNDEVRRKEKKEKRKRKKRTSRSSESDSNSSDDSNSSGDDEEKRKRKKRKKEKKSKDKRKKKSKHSKASLSSSSSSSSSSSDSDEDRLREEEADEQRLNYQALMMPRSAILDKKLPLSAAAAAAAAKIASSSSVSIPDANKNQNNFASTLFGYSDDANPFNDSKLSSQFVWKKKIAKERKEKLKKKKKKKEKKKNQSNGTMGADGNVQGINLEAGAKSNAGDVLVGDNSDNSDDDDDEKLTPEQIEEKERKRREEIASEIIKMKEQRRLRDLEKQKRQEEKEKLMREKQRQNYDEWELKEEEFHLKQAKLASEIRIKEGRPKPIDIVSRNLQLLDIMEDESKEEKEKKIQYFPIEVKEPYRIFDDLRQAGTEELQKLKEDIEMNMKLDVKNEQFWIAMMILCEYEFDQAKLREYRMMKQMSNDESLEFASLVEAETIHNSVKEEVIRLFSGKSYQDLQKLEAEMQSKIDNPIPSSDGAAAIDVEYWENLIQELQIFKAKAFLRETHKRILDIHLQQLKQNPSLFSEALKDDSEEQSTTTKSDHYHYSNHHHHHHDKHMDYDGTQYNKFNDGELGENEEIFQDEVMLDTQPNYSWTDKYRPRKPKFFNRVHTGYEWNKYNQMHYDHDNPPPKVIQGYKFNIFYPDLIDKSKTPTYFIEKGPTKDTCIIRFHAGPPYEDIAFKIINREWEKSHRRGFRCTFDRGVMHLWFHFKRFKYRR